MTIIDLRSDTVTLPTKEMLDAIYNAELGDDILGEDPTVKQLENLAAKMLGKEAALFLVSGTMANQVAVMTLTNRGQEIIVGEDTHIFNLEVAALATLSQVQARPLACPNGYYDPVRVEDAIQKNGIQNSQTGLICLENTYHLNRGMVMSIENINEICSIGKSNKIPVYMDGARIFNAAAALKEDVSKIVENVDAVQFCLSKALGAPIGSLLLGSGDFIENARKMRQRLGGGMRQAGVIAAAGIIALNKMTKRLEDDHYNAKILATGIEEINKNILNLNEVQTNIVFIDIDSLNINADEFYLKLLNNGIKIKKIGISSFRMVCHHNISMENVYYVLDVFRKILK